MSDAELPEAADGHGDTATRTPVTLQSVRADSPHLQPATRYPDRMENLISVALFLGLVCFAGFGAAYWVNAVPWVLAVTFGAGLCLMGFGLTAWGKYLMPRGPFVEERHQLAGTTEERDAMAAAVVERTKVSVGRRPMLAGLFAAASGLFGLVLLFPLLRSLGPLPGDSFDTTNWKRGTYLVDSTGRRINIGTVVPGGLVTVYPEGRQNTDEGQAIDQTVLIRVDTAYIADAQGHPQPTTHGYVAYSKMCTHLGCPVGLYEQELNYLVCPCHQSMFNVLEGCIPIFGPAPRPLPQLQLMVDDNGDLQAAGPYDQPVGPGFWERS